VSGAFGPPVSSAARVRRLACFALATFLAFPQPLAGIVLDLGLALAWVVPGLLVSGLRGLAPRQAARAGLLAGLAAHSAVLHWIYVVTVVYGHAPAIAGVLAPVALAIYIAAFTACFAAGFAWLDARGRASPWALAALWASLDYARSFVLTGFPWATLGYAQHENTALLGLASWTGVYGLSFASALASTAGESLFVSRARGHAPSRSAYAALACVLLLHAFGVSQLAPEAGPEAKHLRVAVAQGNIDQNHKWSPDWARQTLDLYAELTRRAAVAGAELVVWPESAVPGSAGPEDAAGEFVSALARELRVSLLVGAVGLDRDAEGRVAAFYDSALLYDAGGNYLARYDKSHLVPFGEYVPFRDLLGSFLSAVARGIASQDVSPGPGPSALVLGEGESASRIGAAVCYELIFPDVVRRFAGEGGAELLLGITNDAWYGRTGAPYQFLAITALRAAENRLWLARAANTGVSAFIDARGRVVQQTPIFARGLLVQDLPLRPAPLGGSFYARHGDVFAWCCWFGTAIALWRARGGRSRFAGAIGAHGDEQ
jgi:apolipoprotein N-acyltransferase